MRHRNYATALLVVAFVLAYGDRLMLNVLLPSIRSSFQLTLMQGSLLVGLAFSIFFSIAGIPLGLLVDRTKRRTLLAVGIALWSLATIASGLSTSFWQLFVARIAVGIGEACLQPASASLIADYYPPAQRGRAIAITQAGSPFGTLMGTMGAGWLLTWFDTTHLAAKLGWGLESWHLCFLVLGAPGLILAALLMGIAEPARREAPDIRGVSQSGAMGLFRRNPLGFFAFIMLYATTAIIPYAILAWAPTIYITSYHMSPRAAGTLFGCMVVVVAVPAFLLAGFFSDRLMRKRPKTGRVLTPGPALLMCLAAMVWLQFTHSVTATTIALAMGTFVASFVSGSAIPGLQAVTPNRLRGRLVALLFLASNTVGAAGAPSLVAFFAEGGPGGGVGLQRAIGMVCAGAAVVALGFWWLVLRTYGGMRNFEIDDMDDTTAEAPAAVAVP